MIVFENTLAGIQPVAAVAAGPPVQPSWPAPGAAVAIRKGRRDALARMLGEAAGEVVSVYERGDETRLDAEFLSPQFAGTVRGLGLGDVEPAPLEEAGPDAPGAEGWIRRNKREFKERYGKAWQRVLYGKAWKLFGGSAVNRKFEENAVDVLVEDYGASDSGGGAPPLTVTVSGDVGSGKSAVLGLINKHLSAAGMNTVFEAPGEERDASPGMSPAPRPGTRAVLRARYAPVSEAAEGPMEGRRSLTSEEAARLKVPRDKLECSVGFVPGKGYLCWTHRARSRFYPAPERIPASALEFISSTS